MNYSITGKSRKALRRTGLGFTFALSLTAAMAAAPATVSGTYGSVIVGDLPGMIDKVGELAQKVNPGLSGELIRGQLGMFLGDAGLSSIPKGSGLAVSVTTDGTPFLLVETAEGKAETLAETLKQRGMQATAVNGKLLAASPQAKGLEVAKGEAGTAVAAQLSGNDNPYLDILLDADKLIADKGADLKSELTKAASRDKDSSATKELATFAANAIVAIGKRTDVVELKVIPSAEGLTFEKVLYPVGGATGIAAPEGPTGADIGKSIPTSGDALGRYEVYADTQSTVKGISAILNEALEGVSIPGSDKASIDKLLSSASEGYGDAMAGWVTMGKAGSKGVYAITVTNEAKALEYIEESFKQIKDGGLGTFYKSIGLKSDSSFTRNAGTVDGVPYHKFTVKMEGEKAPKNMSTDISDGRLAVVGDKMVIAIDGAMLEEAVKSVKAGSAASAKAVTAATALPAGGSMYIDYDASALSDTVASESKEVGEFLATLKGMPIQEAFYLQPDSLKFVVRIPGELIGKAAAGAMEASQKARSKAVEEESKSDDSAAEKKDDSTN